MDMSRQEFKETLMMVQGIGQLTVQRIMEAFEKQNFFEPQKYYTFGFDESNLTNAMSETFADAAKDAYETCSSDGDDHEWVYIYECVRCPLVFNTCEEQVIQSMVDNIEDDSGRLAEDILPITLEQEKDLADMIDKTVQAWIHKHSIQANSYIVVGKEKYWLLQEFSIRDVVKILSEYHASYSIDENFQYVDYCLYRGEVTRVTVSEDGKAVMVGNTRIGDLNAFVKWLR